MGGGKLPPRQKMIGMMYLVLTALLAMNVSKDILNAFVIVNDGLETTNRNFQTKNEVSYQLFEKSKLENPQKVTPFYNKAQSARQLSKELFDHIELLKKHLIKETEKIEEQAQADTTKLKNVGAKDNYDIPSFILIGEPSKPKTEKWSANELKLKINKTREQFLGLVGEKAAKGMHIGLETPDFGMINGANETWETGNFDHTPLAASITILSKLQADVRNAESDIVKELYSAVDASDFKFDKLEARVIPKSNYVNLGEEFSADVFVAAYNSTQNPLVQIGEVDTSEFPAKIKGNFDTIPVQMGVGKYSTKPGADGLKKWSGLINVKSPDGSIKTYPFYHEYMVAKPALVISADKMNVLYVGVDNPISISVPGVASELLSASVEGGTLSPGPAKGTFIARMTKASKASKIMVSQKTETGSKNVGFMEFRVKTLPTPQAKFAGKSGSFTEAKSKVLAYDKVLAEMENFDFALKIDVVSFSLELPLGGGDIKTLTAKGTNKLTPEMLSGLKNLKNNSKFYITEIKARMPDGTTRPLNDMAIKVRI